MKIDEIKAKLPADFEKMNFERRVEELSKLLGAPSKKWRERYPSGGGSSYAKWHEHRIMLQTGGYDIFTDRGYTRLPFTY